MSSFSVLSLSGSLRAASSNSALLQAAAALAPSHVQLRHYVGWGELPSFNPDQELSEDAALVRLRAAVRDADAVLIACPEYAHGLPGAFKNALDWLVGSGELINKPVAALNASGRAMHAQASLLETLAMMNADVVLAASLTVNLPSNRLDRDAMLADPDICAVLQQSLAALDEHLQQLRRMSEAARIDLDQVY